MGETLHVPNLAPATIRLADGLMLLHAVLQGLDLLTTYMALGAGGHEANPLARSVIEGPGWWAFAALKLGVAAAFVACMPLLRHLGRPEGRMLVGAVALFAAFMVFVVVNNALIAV